jgi:1-deoxy-D-xylulose-5-phosphate synthase
VAVGTGETFGEAFGREIVRHGHERPDLVAITAAMCGPTGLTPFATAFPDRIYDVGIAEQHAMGSAAGLALGGMHPVIALYSTFLNRALDQLLMDCALHKLGVTVVLDRSGITGPDGPSHHGMWDLTLGAMIPGLRVAAPRDVPALVEQFAEALQVDDGPTLLRYPKGEAPEPLSARRRVGGVDVLAEPAGTESDVLLIGVGPFAALGVEVAARLADQGIRVTVVDPRWVLPVPPEITEMATGHRLVVTVEDGGRSGGVGATVADMLRPTGVPVRIFALPQEFLPAGSRTELLTEVGLTTQAIARGITEDIAGLEQTSSTGEVHPWTPGLER